jgi:hypothetical protein
LGKRLRVQILLLPELTKIFHEIWLINFTIISALHTAFLGKLKKISGEKLNSHNG